jgi:hypothetical protein
MRVSFYRKVSCHVFLSPAFRMVVGMFFAALAFIVCGFVELAMEVNSSYKIFAYW